MSLISPQDLRRLWVLNQEVALFDAREEGPFAEAHPFFAVPLPIGQIETRIFALVPRRETTIVFYDDGEGLAERAQAIARGLGYSDVRLLDGGLSGYARTGEVFRDVNVPSKAFGELVESIRHTPSLSAEEVKALLVRDPRTVVVDARRFEEYRTMSIPRGVSVPGAELALRVAALAPDPSIPVIVNCAGRTRSIIGTQSLINAGLPNKVAALRNGTIGWTLAGQALEHGQTRRASAPDATARKAAQDNARQWADKVGVRELDAAGLAESRAAAGKRTTHFLDVRQPEEYGLGHPPGFVSAPGGQLVQATDEWVAVRGARLVLWDDDGVRARMTASWLVQMGWDAVVVADGILAPSETSAPPAARPQVPDVPHIQASALAAARTAWTVVDLARSPAYRKAHLPGAQFAIRSRFAADLAPLAGRSDVAITSSDGLEAAWAAKDAAEVIGRPVHVLEGGTAAWIAAGHALTSEDPVWLSPPIDVYKRPYEGTDNAHAAMQAYIDWELELVAQLANDGISNFRVVRG